MAYRDDPVDDLEGEPGKQGHPVIAIVVGLVLAVVAASGPPHFRSESAAYNLGYVFGGALLATVIAWFWTVRHASLGWRIGASLAIFLMFVLSALSQLGAARQAETADVRAAHAQIDKMVASGEITDVAAGTTPLGKMQAVAMNGVLRDQRAFNARAQQLGLAAVVSFEGLTHDSPILRNCAALTSLADDAHAVGASLPRHIEEARAASEGLDLSDEQRDAFVRGALAGAPKLQHQWNLNAGMVREAQQLCVILARGHWVRDGVQVNFTKPAELSEAQPHLARMKQLQAEAEQLALQSRQSMKDELASFN